MFKHVVQVTGFLAACVGLYAWFTAPTAGLEAEVHFAEFEMPAAVAQQLRALAPLTRPEGMREIVHTNFRQKLFGAEVFGAIEQAGRDVNAFVNKNAPIVLNKNDYAFKGYWKVTVRNTGSKSASSVTLHFPITVSGVIGKPHANTAPIQELTVSTTRVFLLGNILPGDEDENIVYAWSLEPSSEEAKKITLTHDVGVGRIRVLR